jgi:hypothetical protein
MKFANLDVAVDNVFAQVIILFGIVYLQQLLQKRVKGTS